MDFESKDMAMEKLKDRWEDDAYLLEGLENPLQNSMIIELTNISLAVEVVKQIQDDDYIDSISYYKDVIDKMLTISRIISTAGLAIILLLSIVSLFIIANTIKIALYARKREINIMKYIGATNWFIRWPFIIEGMTLGFLGAVIALGSVYVLYGFIFCSAVRVWY